MAQNLQAVGGSEEGYGHYLDKKRPLEIFIEALKIANAAQVCNAVSAGPHGQGTDIDQLVSRGNASAIMELKLSGYIIS